MHELFNRAGERAFYSNLWWVERAAGPFTVKEADIPVGSGKIFPDAQAVITQPKKGQFKAFSAICTHMGCLVDSITTTINCPCHGSKYSIADGSVVNPPAPKPLPPKTIRSTARTWSSPEAGSPHSAMRAEPLEAARDMGAHCRHRGISQRRSSR